MGRNDGATSKRTEERKRVHDLEFLAQLAELRRERNSEAARAFVKRNTVPSAKEWKRIAALRLLEEIGRWED